MTTRRPRPPANGAGTYRDRGITENATINGSEADDIDLIFPVDKKGSAMFTKWMSKRNADIIELHANSGGSLVLSSCPPAWPNHVHFLYRGSTDLELGNMYIEHYKSQFFMWCTDRDSMQATCTIDDLSMACLGSFSPLQYVSYGSLAPHPHLLLIQDAKNAPIRVVAKMGLAPERVDAWRGLISGFPGD